MAMRLINTVLVVAGLAMGLLAAELIVRGLGVAPEVVHIEKWRMRLAKNPKIGFEPIPNLDATGKSTQFYQYIGRSNAMGFRDYDHSVIKPRGVRRIIVLGDSVTAGLWINDD